MNALGPVPPGYPPWRLKHTRPQSAPAGRTKAMQPAPPTFIRLGSAQVREPRRGAPSPIVWTASWIQPRVRSTGPAHLETQAQRRRRFRTLSGVSHQKSEEVIELNVLEHLMDFSKLTPDEVEKAACPIQAHIRGRIEHRRYRERAKGLELMEMNHAARKIQAVYRRRRGRRQVGQKQMLMTMIKEQAQKRNQDLLRRCFAQLGGKEGVKRLRKREAKEHQKNSSAGHDKQLAFRRAKAARVRTQRRAEEQHRQEKRATERARMVQARKGRRASQDAASRTARDVRAQRDGAAMMVWKEQEAARQEMRHMHVQQQRAHRQRVERERALVQVQKEVKAEAAWQNLLPSREGIAEVPDPDEDEIWEARKAARDAWLLGESASGAGQGLAAIPGGWFDAAEGWRQMLRAESERDSAEAKRERQWRWSRTMLEAAS